MSNKSNGVKMKDNDYLQFVSTCEYNTLIRLCCVFYVIFYLELYLFSLFVRQTFASSYINYFMYRSMYLINACIIHECIDLYF